MFEIKVMGIAKAKSLIGADWPTHIISIINDAGPNWPATHIDRQHDFHAIWEFHDVENDEPMEYQELVKPTMKTMREIMEQVEAWNLGDGDKLLIHCSAGKSRSTAIALAILVRAGMTFQDAMGRIKLLSPAMCPNRLMVEMFDEILGQDGQMINQLNQWYDEKILRVPGLNFPGRGGYNR